MAIIITKATVDIVRKELDRIKRERGAVTNRAIVDTARDEKNALHSFFEWNDAVAGDKYRLLQAGQLVQSVRVFVEKDAEPPTKNNTVKVLPAEVPAPKPRSKPSASTPFSQVSQARIALEAWLQKYDRVPEIQPACDHVERAIRDLEVLEDPRAEARTG